MFLYSGAPGLNHVTPLLDLVLNKLAVIKLAIKYIKKCPVLCFHVFFFSSQYLIIDVFSLAVANGNAVWLINFIVGKQMQYSPEVPYKVD